MVENNAPLMANSAKWYPNCEPLTANSAKWL